jgi:predicted ATPase
VLLEPGASRNNARYPFNIPAIRALGELSLHPDVTFFVGENGSGKSTLLEAIALALGFGPEGGTRNMVLLETAKTVSSLYEDLQTVRGVHPPRDGFFLRAESFFNVATYTDDVGATKAYDFKSLHERSHGEAFLAVLNQKLKGKGLYIFDEPEAALSPSRQLAALVAIDRLVNEESQFIIATHSPILMAYPRSKIVRFDEDGLTEIGYEQTEHYAVTRRFLNDHQRMLGELLRDE